MQITMAELGLEDYKPVSSSRKKIFDFVKDDIYRKILEYGGTICYQPVDDRFEKYVTEDLGITIYMTDDCARHASYVHGISMPSYGDGSIYADNLNSIAYDIFKYSVENNLIYFVGGEIYIDKVSFTFEDGIWMYYDKQLGAYKTCGCPDLFMVE